MRILVVDDSATMRRIVVNSLRRIGFHDVVEAEDGQVALERFNDSVGVVITDWNMPRLDGLDLARQLRARGESVPIMMVTTRSSREDILAAIGAGVDDYLVKPFTPGILKEKIDQLLLAGSAN